jgi:hypothetical protein
MEKTSPCPTKLPPDAAGHGVSCGGCSVQGCGDRLPDESRPGSEPPLSGARFGTASAVTFIVPLVLALTAAAAAPQMLPTGSAEHVIAAGSLAGAVLGIAIGTPAAQLIVRYLAGPTGDSAVNGRNVV